MLVDSHCHLDMLDLAEYDGDLSKVIEQAKSLGVKRFLCVSVELALHDQLLAIAQQFPEVYLSVGVHPNEDNQLVTVEQLVALAQKPQVIAIGETGLDYYREYDQDIQQQNFISHIEASKQLGKPLIIHTRSAQEDTVRLMRDNQAEKAGGVMHCFTESWEMAESALALGFYISISGIVTFKNAKQVQEVAQKVPLDRLLVETDSPYLAPVPYRGKQNIPGYTHYVAEHIAQLRGISYEEIAKATTDNFSRLFAVDVN